VVGKRLFWISIIIVELVVVYLLWKPYRHHLVRSSHRVAAVPRPAPSAEIKTPPALPPFGKPPIAKAQLGKSPSGKPMAAIRSTAPAPPRRRVVVNAALKAPEPQPASAKPAAQAIASPLDSFWCNLSKREINCDCDKSAVSPSDNLVISNQSGMH